MFGVEKGQFLILKLAEKDDQTRNLAIDFANIFIFVRRNVYIFKLISKLL